MTQEEINKVAQEYAEEMAELFPELKEKRKYRDKIAQAGNVINLLLRNYNVTPKDNTSKQEVTIEAWVARDKNGFLAMHNTEPEMFFAEWISCHYISLRLEDFPSITWENSPKKVKVTIELEGK